MKHLKFTHILYLGLFSLATLVTTCDKNPAGIDLDKEKDFIPWELISGKIAYRYTSLSSDNSVNSTEIILIDSDKRTVKSITKDNSSLTYSELTWSADGEKIVYSDFNSNKGRWQLYELNMTSGELQAIYPSEFHRKYPSWSNDGRLAYSGGSNNIWIDGTIFYQGSINSTPTSWSPDSKYLVASIRDSTSQGAIYKISLADTMLIPLVQGSGAFNDEIFYDPVWSPDGSSIAYVKTSTAVEGAIWIMDADGSNQKVLMSGSGGRSPEWSPNGERLLFERDGQLFIINRDGSELTQVTKSGSPYHGQFPEWIQ